MISSISTQSRRSAPFYWFLIFATLFSLQILPRLFQDSPAGDENRDIVDGYYFWKGDVFSTPDHPPLSKALQALPLWAMGLQSKSGLKFSDCAVRDAYFLSVLNKEHFEKILVSARFVTYLFGLAIGWILFGLARSQSLVFIITVMTLWTFEPGLLAFSGFAVADLPLAFFFFAAVLLFQKSRFNPSRAQAVGVGLVSGMAVTAKFTAFLLVPIFLILEILFWFQTKPRTAFMVIVRKWIWGLGSAFLWVCFVYLPGTFGNLGHPWPWILFWDGVRSITGDFIREYYFKGVLSFQNHWDYYPTVFVLKSPLTFLILLGIGLTLFFSRKIKCPIWQWLPPLVFFTAFLFFHDMGLRMILPVYPFCILIAGRAGEWLVAQDMDKRHSLTIIWAGLLIFQIFSVGTRYPAQVSYFNELVPPARRLYWLGDSNLDIGQDTRRLAEAVQAQGWNHVKLAYFGGTDPKLYGMNWYYWTQKDLRDPQPGWVYAINDEYIQMGPAYTSYAPDILKSWIMKVKPTGQIADTWYYFVIPGKVQPDVSPRIISAPLFLDNPHAFQ
jgi:hypothetical protein